MDRIERLLGKVSTLPDSQLKVSYQDGRAQIDLGSGRGQTVFIERDGDCYVLTSVVLGATRTGQQSDDLVTFAGTLWRRNRQTDVVNFIIDGQNRLVGRIDHPAETLDAAELFFYLARLAIECDRMEYLLTGENRF
jgi:hypothetical protein